MTDPLTAALGYVARGWFPIPLCWPVDGRCGCGLGHAGRDIGKAPLAARGYPLPSRGWQGVRATEADVRRWWGAYPRANVGLRLELSALLVIDPDSPEAVEEVKARGVSPTPTVRTGGGWHLYHARPAGVEPGRKTHGGACGHIDVLAKGYVVAPPSLHLNNRRYLWVPDRANLPLADPPAWAVEMLPAHRAPALPAGPTALPATPERLSRHLEAVLRDGHTGHYPSRSEAVAAVVCGMIRAGHPDGEIVTTLTACPWACLGKSNPARYFGGEVERARADGVRPEVLDLAPAAQAEAAFRRLPASVRALLASDDPKRRMAGAVEAARCGLPAETLCTLALAMNGGDLEEARGIARWAVWKAGGAA